MSVQGSTVIPSLRYREAHAAIEWLVRVFEFTKQAVYEGPNHTVMHAQLARGGGMLMLGSATNADTVYARRWISVQDTGGRETVGLCLIANSDDDCDQIYERVKREGVEIVMEMNSPNYGGKAFSCCDLEGHIWWVGSYNPWAEHKGPEAEGTA
ncbi:MAG TPA: VOC family protein [Candidatus Aquilonibacter sp.]|nr:VOC family protein [Candidatus Aquilonibacter sp.]